MKIPFSPPYIDDSVIDEVTDSLRSGWITTGPKVKALEELENAGLAPYYTDHGVDVYPVSAAGVPFTASYIAAKGDPIANMQEDLAADVAPLIVQHQ